VNIFIFETPNLHGDSIVACVWWHWNVAKKKNFNRYSLLNV